MKTFSTPILFIIFNRPDTTAIVFEEIRKLKPARLFITADGPRRDRDGEAEQCKLTREVVANIDWECEVKTLYRTENLGCKAAVSSAITWFFEHVEEGIILEDDCLPNPDFFQFLQEMLTHYRTNEKVMMVSGYNIAETWTTPYSYLFSKYAPIWGWATWKRAWNKYDGEMKDWHNTETKNILRKAIDNNKQWKIKEWIYERAFRGNKNSWAYPWEYSCMINGGLSIVPKINLIQNIGFGTNATHTQATNSDIHPLSVPTHNMHFPLSHPADIVADKQFDEFFINRAFNNVTTYSKMINKFKKAIEKYKSWLRMYKMSAPIRTSSKTPRYTSGSIEIDEAQFSFIDSASFISAYREIFLNEIYKFKTTSQAPYIIDCGANVGVSLLYFKKKYPNASIDAFEPDPNIFKVLKKNMESFQMKDVTLHQAAVSDSAGTATFKSDGADGGRLQESTDSSTGKSVTTVRIRDYLNRPVDLLKIDIEGAEDIVIQDISEHLSQVKNIFIEYHSIVNKPQQLGEILLLLKRAGLRYYIQDVGVKSHSPFHSIKRKQGFDNQLNIFAYRP